MEVFSGLLDDIQSILHRYESVMRIVKQVDFSSHSSIHQEDTGDIPILDFPSETESTPSEAEHTSSDAPK
jgi:hypothetical protein